ncbi:hypothetical protein PC123_g25568 [Phytophthora cactorum]|nr:hypothetical protein PC123_g25568 [Phytophthora cactorum]
MYVRPIKVLRPRREKRSARQIAASPYDHSRSAPRRRDQRASNLRVATTAEIRRGEEDAVIGTPKARMTHEVLHFVGPSADFDVGSDVQLRIKALTRSLAPRSSAREVFKLSDLLARNTLKFRRTSISSRQRSSPPPKRTLLASPSPRCPRTSAQCVNDRVSALPLSVDCPELWNTNYSMSEIERLLALVVKNLLLGKDKWKRLVATYNTSKPRGAAERDYESLRRKFNTLYSTRKPDMPPRIKKTNEIKMAIDERADVVEMDDGADTDQRLVEPDLCFDVDPDESFYEDCDEDSARLSTGGVRTLNGHCHRRVRRGGFLGVNPLLEPRRVPRAAHGFVGLRGVRSLCSHASSGTCSL